MNRAAISPRTWRWLVGAIALTIVCLLGNEIGYAYGPLTHARTGSLGLSVVDRFAITPQGHDTQHLLVTSLAPQSPLRAAGVAPGDFVGFDRPIDRWREFGIGETVALTLHSAASTRHIQAATQPAVIRFPEYFDWLGRLLLAVPALSFGLLIGFRQSHERAYRPLSLAFLSVALIAFYTFDYAPAGPMLMFAKVASRASYPLIWYCCARFALGYQPYRATRLRHGLLRMFPWYRVLAYGTAAYAAWFALGHETPGLGALSPAVAACGLLVAIASLADGLKQSSGQMRQRHRVLLLSFALGAVPSVLTLVPVLDMMYNGVRLIVMASFAGQLLMYIGLAYAVLRHHVFDFGFVISRAVVFSVVSLLLLCLFGLMEWLFAPWLHGAAPVRSQGWIDAGLALLVYLGFNQMRSRIERWIERIVFHRWHQNEEQLREFVRQAAHFMAPDKLVAAFAVALDRFTQDAGVAIYLARPDGQYALAVSTLLPAVPALAPGDWLSDARAAHQDQPGCHAHAAGASGSLLLQMSHRGELGGFVVLGSKPSRDNYRPDECAVLGFAVQQIGLDLHALRVEALEIEVAELAGTTERQTVQLHLLEQRRQAVRNGTGAVIAAPGSAA